MTLVPLQLQLIPYWYIIGSFAIINDIIDSIVIPFVALLVPLQLLLISCCTNVIPLAIGSLPIIIDSNCFIGSFAPTNDSMLHKFYSIGSLLLIIDSSKGITLVQTCVLCISCSKCPIPVTFWLLPYLNISLQMPSCFLASLHLLKGQFLIMGSKIKIILNQF